MKNMACMYVEFESNKHGSLVCTDDSRTLRINNSPSYPVTHGVVKEFKKMLNKETLSILKASGHNMITVYGYDDFYTTKAFHRFTFDHYNGKVHIETRPYVHGEGFDIEDTIEFDNDKQARKYIVDTIAMYVNDNIDIQDNNANYFTKDM